MKQASPTPKTVAEFFCAGWRDRPPPPGLAHALYGLGNLESLLSRSSGRPPKDRFAIVRAGTLALDPAPPTPRGSRRINMTPLLGTAQRRANPRLLRQALRECLCECCVPVLRAIYAFLALRLPPDRTLLLPKLWIGSRGAYPHEAGRWASRRPPRRVAPVGDGAKRAMTA